MFDTHTYPVGGKNHFHFILSLSVKTHQCLCAAVWEHLLFRATNTDAELSLAVWVSNLLPCSTWGYISSPQSCLGCYSSSAGDTLCVWGGNTCRLKHYLPEQRCFPGSFLRFFTKWENLGPNDTHVLCSKVLTLNSSSSLMLIHSGASGT